ncbi:hypothetical protein J2S43_001447 [Catenuloplanes nepalensis]|uniref:DUF3850 domain-containing protein n=1 Tax=Catenuloplanes nepalensis TaxID=587533 RepID=A0ABT9MND2_9ACTN|nr:hypothetical protein [Catenuloplanes nepalensis]MDP9792935.1 hypothetical protein [Catenuloplanes nepalensis]
MSVRKLLTSGDVLRLAVDDYKFGTLDPLRLRIERVVEVHDLEDGRWVEVAGVMLNSEGSPIKPRPYTLVRAEAIRRVQRSTEAAAC